MLEQCKMYIATLRIADDFGCDAVGIQYQQGLKDLDAGIRSGRRPAQQRRSAAGQGPRQAKPLYHRRSRCPISTKWTKCVALDALVTNRVWTALGLSPETTLHDVRYGEDYGRRRFIWTLGDFRLGAARAFRAAAMPRAVSERQPPMYFRLGGGTIKGISKPGARRLEPDLYRSRRSSRRIWAWRESVALPREETERRWPITTPQWPMMHTRASRHHRDQFMARHCSNHIQVAYAPDKASAAKALYRQGGDVSCSGH